MTLAICIITVSSFYSFLGGNNFSFSLLLSFIYIAVLFFLRYIKYTSTHFWFIALNLHFYWS